MMVLGISILPKQNIQNGRMFAKDAIFLFQVFSVPSHFCKFIIDKTGCMVVRKMDGRQYHLPDKKIFMHYK